MNRAVLLRVKTNTACWLLFLWHVKEWASNFNLYHIVRYIIPPLWHLGGKMKKREEEWTEWANEKVSRWFTHPPRPPTPQQNHRAKPTAILRLDKTNKSFVEMGVFFLSFFFFLCSVCSGAISPVTDGSIVILVSVSRCVFWLPAC